MSDVHPLPIYPSAPTGAILTMLKEAKARLDTKVLLTPVRAVQGSPGRIISIGEKLPWLDDHAIVANPSVDSFEAALRWALGMNEDTRAVTVLRQLKEILGPDVKEIEPSVQF